MYPRVSQGRRILGITFDWLACYAIALGFFAGGGSLADRIPGARFPVLILLFAEYALFVTPLQAIIRTALLLPVVTAITFDENGRGINERLSNTVLVKSRI
jgi:hypothetical protein